MTWYMAENITSLIVISWEHAHSPLHSVQINVGARVHTNSVINWGSFDIWVIVRKLQQLRFYTTLDI